jgi:YgiT-type zinc finger domain-containing protein
MQPGMAIHTIHRRTYHLIIHDTPALVCNQCGEEWFDGEVVQMFDEAIDALDNLNEQLAAFAPKLEVIAAELAKPQPTPAPIPTS